MPSDLRLLCRALKKHPGPPIAAFVSVLILMAAMKWGATLWVFAPLALVWWVPVFWTAWKRRNRYKGEHDSTISTDEEGRLKEGTEATFHEDSKGLADHTPLKLTPISTDCRVCGTAFNLHTNSKVRECLEELEEDDG